MNNIKLHIKLLILSVVSIRVCLAPNSSTPLYLAPNSAASSSTDTDYQERLSIDELVSCIRELIVIEFAARSLQTTHLKRNSVVMTVRITPQPLIAELINQVHKALIDNLHATEIQEGMINRPTPNFAMMNLCNGMRSADQMWLAIRLKWKLQHLQQKPLTFQDSEHGHNITIPSNLSGLLIAGNHTISRAIDTVTNFGDLVQILSTERVEICPYDHRLCFCNENIPLFIIFCQNLPQRIKERLDLNKLLGNALPANQKLILEEPDVCAFALNFVFELVKISQEYEGFIEGYARGTRRAQINLLDL